MYYVNSPTLVLDNDRAFYQLNNSSDSIIYRAIYMHLERKVCFRRLVVELYP